MLRFPSFLALCAALSFSSAHAAPAAAPAPRPALAVTTTTPVRAPLTVQLPANGNVAAWQEASVGAEVGGLRLAQVLVNVGDAVRAGQVLARFATDLVQADVAQARAAVQQAQAQARESEANARRAQALAGSGAMSVQQIEQLAAADQAAQAAVAQAQAVLAAQQLRLAHTEVKAPDAGVISARQATVGAVVGVGVELFRMVRQGRLEWRAEVTAADLAQLAVGASAEVTTAAGTQVQGRVRMLAPTLDPATRTALVYVDLPRHPDLRAGMYARGQLAQGQRKALTLPLSAVVVRDGFESVFVLQAEDRVQLRRVRTGQRSGARVEIVEGLQEGAAVVASGGTFLNDGDLVRVVKGRE